MFYVNEAARTTAKFSFKYYLDYEFFDSFSDKLFGQK